MAPPLISTDDKENYPLFQERYKNIPVDECPRGESLKDTIHRVLPYWDSHISKEIEKGKNVIVTAHGNSLRALIQYLLKIDNKKILELNLPTGKPLIFEINGIKPYKTEVNFITVKIEDNFILKGLNVKILRGKMIEKGILIRDASNFKFLDERFFRLAIKNRKNNDRVIETLKKIFDDFI